MQAPQLFDLWLDHCSAKAADLRAIIESPWFDNLRAVTFSGPRLSEASLDLLAQRPCVSKLRILRLRCGDSDAVGSFKSLGTSALADSDAFAGLTTLQIEYPYAKKAKRDTADLLRQLKTPNLRHLTLKDCDFDGDCAAALAENPSFANLTRLHLNQGYEAPPLSPRAAQAMLRSPNLQKLVEIELHEFALGKAVEVFADLAVLPNLKSGAIWGSNASRSAQEMIKRERPNLHIGS